jgi:hypothetical protein
MKTLLFMIGGLLLGMALRYLRDYIEDQREMSAMLAAQELRHRQELITLTFLTVLLVALYVRRKEIPR